MEMWRKLCSIWCEAAGGCSLGGELPLDSVVGLARPPLNKPSDLEVKYISSFLFDFIDSPINIHTSCKMSAVTVTLDDLKKGGSFSQLHI